MYSQGIRGLKDWWIGGAGGAGGIVLTSKAE